uniref:Uncharacterized protein n=1 Tax=Siphoviridae sp. ctnLs3 TaxID=2827937 RepID=A0A8S5TDV4_9CAUD|nr:MAG TPA: hypothetical protein [Siphoviridae sp. ctnLs3]DAL14777.1 MAG TPA_asm: hypothetical protein [Caudoviricetes sp.]
MERAICVLVRLGHHHVLEYPWSLFLTALKAE